MDFASAQRPPLRLSNLLAALGGSRPSAGAAVVCASTAASQAVALTRMSRSCLCSARLSPNLAKPSTLLDFARALGGKVTDAGLSSRPLQFT